MIERINVLMSPGRVRANLNRYIPSLVENIRAIGDHVNHWRPYLPYQNGDVFHVHWPELFIDSGFNGGHQLIDAFIQRNFWATIDRVRSGGGALVWTAHNLTPHSEELSASDVWRRYFARFCSSLDGVIYLTEASKDSLHAAYPFLRDVPMATARHMHMRAAMPAPSGRNYRTELGIPPHVRVLAAIGRITRQKGTILLAREFMEQSQPSDWLLLAGEADSLLREEIEFCARLSRGNIVTIFETLTDQQIVDIHESIDAVAFLSTCHLNSGTVMQALSCSRPVIVYDTPSNRELKNNVANGGVFFTSPGKLMSDFNKIEIFDRSTRHKINLNAFDPLAVASQHSEAYRSFLRVT